MSKLDFVKFAEELGYKNPMYLPQPTKDLIGKAMRFAEKYGNSRELEGRIDEINRFDNEYVNVMHAVQGLHERGGYYDERINELLSQEEKTNE